MASIDITTQSGAVGNGDLQLQNGAPMDGTLRFVTDAINTASPLKLSTSLVQTTSTLKITTNDNPYIDAEDGAGNNRFTVGRDTGSQQVNVDFASNPGGSTTIVGAIRTYVDGVNLSEVMAFREDGSVGIGTTAPVGILDLFKSAAATRLAIRGDAGQNRLISYRTGALQRFGLYVNNTAESGANAGSDFAIRAYSDAGTLLSTPFFIQRSTGSVGIGTTSPNIYATGGATNIVSIQATGSNQGAILDIAGTGTGFSGINLGNATIRRAFVGTIDGGNFGIYTNPTNTGTVVSERLTITSAGNVGIGTSTPAEKLVVTDGSILTQGIGGGGAFNILQPITPNTDARTWAIGASVAAFGDFGIKQSNAKDGDPITAGDTKFYISRFGNVGIGTTSPNDLLTISKADTSNSLFDSDSAFTIINTDSGAFGRTTNINFNQDVGTLANRLATIAGVYTNFSTSVGGAIAFSTNNGSGTIAEKARITSDGYLRLTSASGGIQFNGDTAAANALDDYEEGTFTATLTPSVSGSITTSSTFNTWTYTKIGRQVTINGVFVVSSVSSPTGAALLIGGLPFTILNNNGAYGAFSCNYYTSATTSNSQSAAQHVVNTTQLIINKDASLVATSDEIYVTATYFV